MRILLAEDDPVIADGICRALRRGGCAVDHVADGMEADAALAGQAYDLLILDLGLPRMNGIDVLKRLRARKSAQPVLILTAQDGVDDRVRGLDGVGGVFGLVFRRAVTAGKAGTGELKLARASRGDMSSGLPTRSPMATVIGQPHRCPRAMIACMAAKRSADGLGTNSMTQTKFFSRRAVFSRLMLAGHLVWSGWHCAAEGEPGHVRVRKVVI